MPYGANRQQDDPAKRVEGKYPRRKQYGRKWQRYSRRRLAKFPFCECDDCAGKFTPAAHTDHIIPITGVDDPLFWAPLNHQSLAIACHSKKTSTEINGAALRHQRNGTTRPQT